MGILQDVRFALRLLRRNIGFTLTVVFILALGIGANVSIFTLADAVLVRRLPVPDARSLVLLGWKAGKEMPASSFYGAISIGSDDRPSTGDAFSRLSYEEFRAAAADTADLFAFAEITRVNVGIDGRADLASGILVSGNYFGALGVRPAAGRLLTPDDDRSGSPDAAVVLSYRYWHRRFGGDPGIVGHVLRLNGAPFTVVGVAARGFAGTLDLGTAPELFLPVARQPQMMPGENMLDTAGAWWLQIMGRMKPGVPIAQVPAKLSPVLARSASVTEEAARGIVGVTATPGDRGASMSRVAFAGPIQVLALLVGTVLLIACANVAALVLARAEGRRKEIAVRLALGASRGRIVRQLLTESVLMAIAGGSFGLLLARWCETALPAFLPAAATPLVFDLAPGGRVLVFTVVISLATGLLAGGIPAFRATRTDLLPEMKSSPKGRRKGLPGTGDLLVISQVALSLVLTLGGALFLRTVHNLEREDVGFDPRGVLLFKIDPTLNGYEGPRLEDLYQRVLAGLDAIPSVSSATLSRHAPLEGSGMMTNLTVPGTDRKGDWVYIHTVRPNFLETMEIPLIRGRGLSASDVAGSVKVAVVTENIARTFFPHEDPIGRRIRFGSKATDPTLEIVGVAKDARYARLRDGNPFSVYVPYVQHADRIGAMTFEIRSGASPAALSAAVRGVVENIDPNLPLFDIRTQEEQVSRSIASERQFSRLATILAAVGLMLAAVGLYGTLSYATSRRRREIGIRMALGAKRYEVQGMVLGAAVRLAAIGAAIGIAVALYAGHVVASLLYGVQPRDLPTLAGATSVLVLVSLLAGYLPARAAAGVDPAEVLRCE
jgi:predicted permease